MAAISVNGPGVLRVVGKDSDWRQRVVVTGATRTVLAGEIGAWTALRPGRNTLAFEHDPGDGVWRPNVSVRSGDVVDGPGEQSQGIETKDRYWAGDTAHDDLRLHLVRTTERLRVVGRPHALDADLAEVAAPDGELGAVGGPAVRYLSVELVNAGPEPLPYDAAVDVSDAGRRALAELGVHVLRLSPEQARITGQEVHGRGVLLPPLRPGAGVAVHLPIDAAASRPGTLDVELALLGTDGAGRGIAGRGCEGERTAGQQVVGRGVVRGLPVADATATRTNRPAGARAATRRSPGMSDPYPPASGTGASPGAWPHRSSQGPVTGAAVRRREGR